MSILKARLLDRCAIYVHTIPPDTVVTTTVIVEVSTQISF